MSSATILIIEDDTDIRELLVELVERAGMVGLQAGDGLDGVRAFFEHRPELVVLDLGLPMMDGWQVLERIRELSDVPLMLLTADGEQVMKVQGLERGADDYMTKPFDPAELVARIKALLRRSESEGEADELLSDGVFVLDEALRRVEVSGAEVSLTPTEFRLLAALMRNRQHVVSQEQLLETVWGNSEVEPKIVRLYVSYLRRKLEAVGQGEAIETVRGFGYRFRPAASRADRPAGF